VHHTDDDLAEQHRLYRLDRMPQNFGKQREQHGTEHDARHVTEAAQQLDVNRVTLSRVLNGRAAISPEMALRIEAWLGVERGGEARIWLAEQSA
jgi:addiction module HigA family antidote